MINYGLWVAPAKLFTGEGWALLKRVGRTGKPAKAKVKKEL